MSRKMPMTETLEVLAESVSCPRQKDALALLAKAVDGTYDRILNDDRIDETANNVILVFLEQINENGLIITTHFKT